MPISLSASSNRRESVVLPAPEGEDSTSSNPRLSILGGFVRGVSVKVAPRVSFDVLHLLAQLVDDCLQL